VSPTSPLIGLALVVIWSTPIEAHDIYTDLKNKWEMSCCDSSDCRPARYRVSRSGVEMLVNNRWISIPRAMVEHRSLEGDTGETNGGHWCGQPYENTAITYCAFLPPNSALAP
jgi:hypothetical protein